MDLMLICILAGIAALSIATFVIALCNSSRLNKQRAIIKALDEHMYDHCNDICDLMEEVDNIDNYLEEASEKINHNVDMTNIILRNFKQAIEQDRKELRTTQKITELHQDALELIKEDIELLDQNVNDTLDLIEDILIADELCDEDFKEEVEEIEYFDEPKKKSKKQK